MQLNDSHVFPRFHMAEKQSKAKTLEMGYPVFVDEERVEIFIAGDNKNTVVRKVNQEHKDRWPQQYEAFKKGLEQPVDGMPLRQCPLFTAAQVKTMESLNVRTVEALANLEGNSLARLGMGGRVWVAKAQAYLKDANGSKEVTRLAEENEILKGEIEMLKAQMKELGSAIKTAEPIIEEKQETLPSGPLENLNLSTKTVKALKDADVTTCEALFALTPDQISNIKGVGVAALDEIGKLFE